MIRIGHRTLNNNLRRRPWCSFATAPAYGGSSLHYSCLRPYRVICSTHEPALIARAPALANASSFQNRVRMSTLSVPAIVSRKPRRTREGSISNASRYRRTVLGGRLPTAQLSRLGRYNTLLFVCHQFKTQVYGRAGAGSTLAFVGRTHHCVLSQTSVDPSKALANDSTPARTIYESLPGRLPLEYRKMSSGQKSGTPIAPKSAYGEICERSTSLAPRCRVER